MNNSIGLILLGVSGSGKTTIGKLLSKKINIQFIDADDYHSKTNIQLMSTWEKNKIISLVYS